MFEMMTKLTLVILLSVSCGPKPGPTGDVEEQGSFVANTELGGLVSIPLGFGAQSGLGLATPVDQFEMTVEGCTSGLSYVNITESNPFADLYKFDQNCKAKLLSFVDNGNTYQPRAGNDYTAYDVGEIALFENISNTLDTIEVRVGNQLGSPLQETDRVSYGTVQLQESGATHEGLLTPSIVSQGVSITNSEIQYAINVIELVGVSGANNAGVYQFTLECRNRIKQRGKNNPFTCFDHEVIGTTYLLVEDQYGGVPCTSADPSGCDDLFDGSEQLIAVANTLEANSVDAKNGGFQTDPVTSPAELLADPNIDMLLILENSGDYQFYKISVALSQTF